MTPFQVKTLIYQHNKYEEEKRKNIEEARKKIEQKAPKKLRRYRLPRGRW